MSKTIGSSEQGAFAGAPVIEVEGQSGILLDGSFLFSADFVRLGDDLLLRGEDGGEILLRDYFDQDAPPALETAEGARLQSTTVEALAAPETVQGYAQAGDLQLGQPIGEVNLLNGTARVQRPDGTRADLHQGDPIFQGDVVSTGVGSELGIAFVDDTVFSLSANARMIINELIYNPGSTANSMGVSLIQGTFVFVTGQVAPNGGMLVDTPVGTIGIRGTTVGVEIATFGGRTIIANLTNPDTGETGSFLFSNNVGDALFSLANHYLEIRSANVAPGVPSIAAGQAIINAFGRALNTAVSIQRQLLQQQQDQDDPTDQQEGQLEGQPLQAVQEAGLTQDQLDALLNDPVIETAGGSQNGSGTLPGSGSGVGGSLQFESVANNGSDDTFGGSIGGGSAPLPAVGSPGTPPPPPSGALPGEDDDNAPPPPPPPPPSNEVPPANAAPVAADDSITVSESGVSGSSGATPAQVEAFLGLASGRLNAIADDNNAANGVEVATSGTAMKTQVIVEAGDHIGFRYNFLDSEDLGDAATFQDFAFVVIGDDVFRLSNVGEANTPSGATFSLGSYSVQFDEESGYLIFDGTFDVSGAVQIGFGVMNEGDQILDAGLLVDDLFISRFGEQIVFQDDFSSLANWQTLGGDFVTTVGDIGTSDPMPGPPSQALLISAAVSAVPSNVLADNGNGPDSDPDGDTLFVTAVNGSAAAVGSQITLSSGALLTLNADGTFSYDPNGQFDELGEGETAEDSFSYSISDGEGGSDSATVTVTIIGSDDEGGGNNLFTSALAPADLIDDSEGGFPQSGPGAEPSGSSFPLVPQSDPLADMGLEQAIPVA